MARHMNVDHVVLPQQEPCGSAHAGTSPSVFMWLSPASPQIEGTAAAAVFVQAMRDEAATDPSKRLMLGKIMQGGLYNPALLGDRDGDESD